MKVPFLDLKSHHEYLRKHVHDVVDELIDDSGFIGGERVSNFESDFAAYCGTKECVGVGSGTDALWLALMSCNIGPGDEVVTSPMTFVATVEAIVRVGARPVFVDIDSDTYLLDPTMLEEVITCRTKAIIPVHLFGQMADMETISSIAERYGLAVIEDAAQSHGARSLGRRSGAWGAIGCFSFYPGKNLGAFGEAGAITTDDADLAEKIRAYANHGQYEKNRHELVGWNCRLDAFQAVILKKKLARLDEVCELRARCASYYNEGLAGTGGIALPGKSVSGSHVYHVYAIRVKRREEFLSNLENCGVGYGVHYPIPVHLQEAFGFLEYQVGDFPIAESYAKEFVSLPIFPELTDAQMDYVIQSVRDSIVQDAAA